MDGPRSDCNRAADRTDDLRIDAETGTGLLGALDTSPMTSVICPSAVGPEGQGQ